MELVCMILGILFLGYYGLLLFVGMDFSFVWLVGGILLAGGGALAKYMKLHSLHFPAAVRIGGGILLLLGILAFLFLESLVVSDMGEEGEEGLDYVIVLGAQVRGDAPSRALRKRINKAAEYLKENENTKAVLSGGQGPGENRSEAQVMYDCLIEAGIAPERLIREDASTNTVENLEFSGKLIGKDARIGIISQNFHIYRALKLAKHQGYTHVCGIAARSEAIYQPHFMVREACALVKEIAMKNIEIP